MGDVIKADFTPKKTINKRSIQTLLKNEKIDVELPPLPPPVCNERLENGVIVVGETEVFGSKPEKITLGAVLVWVFIIGAVTWGLL